MPAFVTDSFTGTNGTNITAHTGELGATWTKHASASNSGDPQIQTNQLQSTESGLNENYYASGAPASADYSVSLDYTYNLIGGNEIIGPAARMTTGATNTGYFFIYFKNVAELRLYKYVAGTLTQIGSGVAFTPVNGTTYRFTIDPVGTAIAGRIQRLSDSLWINSAGVFGSSQVNCASATDSSITAAGKAGFWYSSNTTSGGTRGTLDNFSADQAGAGPATGITTSGPSGGTVGAASTNFTVGVTPAGGTISGTVIVTPSDSAGGGTFAPTTVSVTTASPTATFTYTPASVGAKTISVTNNGGLTNPANLTYTVTAAAIYNTVITTDTIGGENIMLLVPNSNSAVPYNSANPTRVLLYVHGYGEDHTGLTADSLKFAVRDAFINAGYILAGTNARGNNWGNQASVDSYAALAKYVGDNYNVNGSGFGLWSQSMGGLDGLLALSQGKIKAVGWLGTYPVCNLANLYSLGTYTASIDIAYGITGTGIATYANKTWGNDPVLKQGFSLRHIPLRFYASSGDTVVPKANNTDVLAALVAGSCRESAVVACTGNHGDPSHFDATSYLAFFARCFATPVAQGQPATTKTATLALTSDGTTPRANLTGLKWSWWDQATPDLSEYPTDKGTGATTNASGVFSVTVRTNLATAATGWLVVTDSDGTTAQSPAAKAFSGPVVLA